MIWLLLPLSLGVVALTVAAANWRYFAGESTPALQSLPTTPSTPSTNPKDLPSLPTPLLKPEDWPQVEKALRQVMDQCGPPLLPLTLLMVHPMESNTSAPMIGQMECLLNWLRSQECVKGVRAPMAEAEGKSALRVLTSLPGQIEIEVDFLTESQEVQTWGLSMAMGAGEHFQFVALRKVAHSGP